MKRRRELAIELTPLLDVIMIMLFLILTRNAGNVKEAREEAAQEMASVEQQASSEVQEMQETVEEAEKAAEEAREELSALEGRVQSLEVFEEYSLIISIKVEASGISGSGQSEGGNPVDQGTSNNGSGDNGAGNNGSDGNGTGNNGTGNGKVSPPSASGKAGQAVNVAESPRKILVTCGDTVDTIEFSWSNPRYAENRLKEILKGYFDQAKDMPCFVVFSYNKQEIYKSDFDLVTDVLDNLASNNIYIKTVEE